MGIEKRKGRRETDLAMLAHLSDVLAETPGAAVMHAPAVIERMEPVSWAWVMPDGRTRGRFEELDIEAARAASGEKLPAEQCGWLRPARGWVFRRAWSDGEMFLFSRPPEVEGAERWEDCLVATLAGLLRVSRRAGKNPFAESIAFYGRLESETIARLEIEVDRTRGLELPLTVVFFRVQGLGELNRQAGLAEGDRVFERLAGQLYANGVEPGCVGRAGTDGLLVFFPAQDRGTIETWLRRVRAPLLEALRGESHCASIDLSVSLAAMPADAMDARALAQAVGAVG